MAVLGVMRVATYDGTAADVFLFVVAATSPQKAFWVFWVDRLGHDGVVGQRQCRRQKPWIVFEVNYFIVLHGDPVDVSGGLLTK